MARKTLPLSDTQIKKAKPKDKMYKMFDGDGLYLEVKPSGKKVWRFKYRLNNKEKTYTIGEYPTISLKEARNAILELREMVINGIDPVQKRQEQQYKETLNNKKLFSNIANEFFELKAQELSEAHLIRQKRRVENYILPKIGNKNIDNVTKSDIIEIIKDVKNVKTPSTKNTDKIETAKRIYILIKQIYQFALHNDYTDKNIPNMIDINSLLPKQVEKHLKAITDEKEVKKMYKLLDDYPGFIITKYALKFLALTALRPGNIQNLQWKWIDLENRIINFPASSMKTKRDYRLPLTDTLYNILIEIKEMNVETDYVFFSPTNHKKPISNTLLNLAHKKLDIINHNAHGWRSSFSTICYEKQKEHGFTFEVIESQLSHKVGNSVVRAYMRSDFLEERYKLLEWWEKFLEN